MRSQAKRISLDTILRYLKIPDIEYIEKAYRSGRSVILDLDDTIFPEISFLEHRYKYICETLFACDWSGPYKFLLNEFSCHGRSFLFDKFVSHYKLSYSVEDILDIFRCYEGAPKPVLTTYPWFRELSVRLNHEFPLLLITNGNKLQQMRKIEWLNLGEFFSDINCVFADEYGGKPEAAPLKALARKFDLRDPIYIGDSEVDREFCSRCMIEFIDVTKLIV